MSAFEPEAHDFQEAQVENRDTTIQSLETVYEEAFETLSRVSNTQQVVPNKTLSRRGSRGSGVQYPAPLPVKIHPFVHFRSSTLERKGESRVKNLPNLENSSTSTVLAPHCDVCLVALRKTSSLSRKEILMSIILIPVFLCWAPYLCHKLRKELWTCPTCGKEGKKS